MKKFILMLALLIGSIVSQAQVVGAYVAFPKDSTTDTQIRYFDLATPTAISGNYTMGIHVIPVNKSGTATVTAALQGSNDNTIWFNYGSATTVNTAGTVGEYGWYQDFTHWKYYRVKLSSTGTGVTTFTGGMILKRH